MLFRIITLYALLFALMILQTGCSTYKVVTKETVSEGKLVRLSQKDKYFIIHDKDSTWHLAKPIVWNNELQGYKSRLDDWHKDYLKPPKNRNNKFDRKDELGKDVIKEIHIYVSGYESQGDKERISISINSIQSIEIYKHQNGELAGLITGGIFTAVIIFIIYAIVNISISI